MVDMSAVGAGDHERPRAVAQIAAALGGCDCDLDLGRAPILASLKLGQNGIAAMYKFLLGRYSAAIVAVQCHTARKGVGVIFFLPSGGTRRHARTVRSGC